MRPIQVELLIRNNDNYSFPEIIMRKFFNMIFISGNGKEMNIYTALAFNKKDSNDVNSINSNNKNKRTDNNKKDNTLVSGLDDNDCSIKFKYSVKNSNFSENDNNVVKISYENLTDSLFIQHKTLEKVWATGDEKSANKYEDQKELMNAINKEFTVNNNGAVSANDGVLYFSQPKKPWHTCFLSKGKNFSVNNDGKYVELKTDLAHTKGLESLYWIRTKMVFPKRIVDSELSFTIKFEGSEFHTPDFSWYIAPPEGYVVDVNNATVKYETDDTENESKERLNALMPVSDETTVPFNEWVHEEEIENRNKFRFIKGDVVECKESNWLTDRKTLKMKIKLINPSQTEIKQFIFGLVLAFFLTVCFDKSIMKDAFVTLNLINKSNELTWSYKLFITLNPILICCSYVCFRYKYEAKKIIKCIRKIAIIVPVFLEMLLVISSIFDSSLPCCFDGWNWFLIILLYAISLLFEIIYIFHSQKNHKSMA